MRVRERKGETGTYTQSLVAAVTVTFAAAAF